MSYEKEQLIELISAYLDNELSDRELAQVEELLNSNPEAQAIYEQLSTTTNLFKTIDPVTPPPYLKKKIIRKIKIQNRTSFMQRIKDRVSARRYKFPVLTYASASLILIFFIVYPITIMMEWPADPLSQAQESAQDPFQFTGSDDFVDLYAVAPEMDESEEELSLEPERDYGKREESVKYAGSTATGKSADREKAPEEFQTEVAPAVVNKPAAKAKKAPEAEFTLAEKQQEKKAAEEVETVTGEAPLVDLKTTDESMNISKEAYQALPKGRRFEKLIAKTPGAEEGAAGRVRSLDKSREASSAIEGSRFFVDVVDVYFDHSIKELNGNGKGKKTVITSGVKPQFSIHAETGSNENPIIYSSRLSPILPTMDFTFEDHLTNDFIMILGEVHVSRQGKVLFYKIECPASARKLVAKYGEILKNTPIKPAMFNSQEVSVFYRFIATIYRNDDKTE